MRRPRTNQLPGAATAMPSRATAQYAAPLHINYSRSRPSPHTGSRLLVRMPTRSRPKQALEVLSKYRNMAGIDVALEVIIDEDDASMNTKEVWWQLGALDCVVTVGKHKSKIEAVNGGKVDDWDILLLASDDMVPVKQDYAFRVLHAMEQHFPQLDGALYFNDNYAGKRLCTLPIMGRNLYSQFGYVYFPQYKSLFCDNEQTEVLLAMNRLVYVDELLIEHRHPSNSRALAPSDTLYSVNNAAWNADETLYKQRRELRRPYAQIGFDAPPVWLSICIATVPSRKKMLDELLSFLYAQMAKFPREVEIVIDSREQVTIGKKRDDLNRRAVGRYVAHVDDDDWVADDYVARQLAALKSQPETDCASLRGVMSVDGSGATPFFDSICYTKWGKAANGAYERTPEHRNAVRKDLALKAGYPDISFGEDHEFSRRLRPLLKTEASTGDAPLYFYRFVSKPQSWYYKPPGAK